MYLSYLIMPGGSKNRMCLLLALNALRLVQVCVSSEIPMCMNDGETVVTGGDTIWLESYFEEMNGGKSNGMEDLSSFAARHMIQYGEYCGLGTPCDRNVEPRDKTDAVCQKHDSCWCRNYDFHCGCDRQAISDFLAAAVEPGNTAEGRAVASAAAGYFQTAPCRCRACTKVPYCDCCPVKCGTRLQCTWIPGAGGVGPC